MWYKAIRSIVSDRITSEAERMPTITSMWRHWLRSCWVVNVAIFNNKKSIQASEDSGWLKSPSGVFSMGLGLPNCHEQSSSNN